MTLIFTHMDLEEDDGCNSDYVQVLDGVDELAPLVGKFCGSTSPTPITSQGMALYVQFVSDQASQATGFRAIYSKSTSGTIFLSVYYHVNLTLKGLKGQSQQKSSAFLVC